MKKIKEDRLKQLLKNCHGKNIAVIGDIMVDRYIWGKVSRISPEAPVPVVEVNEEFSRIGGAGNVANNILSLGGNPLLFGIIGKDHAGKELISRMEIKGLDPVGLVEDEARPTTVKTRIIAHNQHVVRADFESKERISKTIEKNLLKQLKEEIGRLDGIILQDYNKGVLTRKVIREVIDMSGNYDFPITVDPKFNHFFEYKGVDLFKPNIIETQNALGFALDSEESVLKAGRELLERLKCEHVLITRGSAGMSLFSKDGYEGRVTTKAKEIADVSGAGDTVISTLTMILAAGGDVREASSIANHAAGVVVGEVGIVAIEPQKIMESFKNNE
ncbi:D-glycero-beta-D-manno-heptose-7-phosphate kinase [candidate division KSB1 bacterium]